MKKRYMYERASIMALKLISFPFVVVLAGLLIVQPGEVAGLTQSESNPVQSYYVFSEDGRECTIMRHDTPCAWLNLLSNDRFVAWVTHDGRIVESGSHADLMAGKGAYARLYALQFAAKDDADAPTRAHG